MNEELVEFVLDPQSYPDMYPLQEHNKYVPKIAGFKVNNGRGVYNEKIETKYRTEI